MNMENDNASGASVYFGHILVYQYVVSLNYGIAIHVKFLLIDYKFNVVTDKTIFKYLISILTFENKFTQMMDIIRLHGWYLNRLDLKHNITIKIRLSYSVCDMFTTGTKLPSQICISSKEM